MPQHLLVADFDTARDVLTFAGRAARVGADGVRLTARDGVMTMQTATLSSKGLLDASPTVIGMRVVNVDSELVCDFVVPADSLKAGALDTQIELPDSAVSPAWAGVAPPMLGWEYVGTVTADLMTRIAQDGIADVADLVPTDAGEDVVRAVRAAVWGPPQEDLFEAPKGVAFTADALGFLAPNDEIRVLRNERWTRFSTQRGHVLSRGPARVGLSPVREVGTTSR